MLGIFPKCCAPAFLITFSSHPPGNFTQVHLVGSSSSVPALPIQPGTLPCWCSWEQAGYGALHLHPSLPPLAPKKKKGKLEIRLPFTKEERDDPELLHPMETYHYKQPGNT